MNEAFGRLRKRNTKRHRAADMVVLQGDNLLPFPGSPAQENPESDLAREQIRRLLEKSVDELPDPFRIVFILREIEGLSTEEVAAELSIRPETVKTRLHRARRLIRASLSERFTAAFSDLFPFDGDRCVSLAARLSQRLRNAGFLPAQTTRNG